MRKTATRAAVCAAGVSLALLAGGAAALAPQGQATPALGAAQAQAAQLYSDTPSDAWYVTQGWLGYVTEHGVMTGYAGTDLFGPEDPVTRAQAAVVVLRLSEPADKSSTDPAQYGQVTNFSDVPAGQWYTSAVEWCRAHGVITGDTDGAGNPLGTFRPDDPVTREELAAMLHRAALASVGAAGSADLSVFPDLSSASPYALEALSWCVANGLLTGDTTTGTPMLAAPARATRAQMAKMLTVLVRDVMGGGPSQGSTPGSGAQQPSAGNAGTGSAGSGSSAGAADSGTSSKPSSGSTSGSGASGAGSTGSGGTAGKPSAGGSTATPSAPSGGTSSGSTSGGSPTGPAGKPSSGGSGSSAGGSTTPSTPSKPAEKTWHETKPAWDEQVLVKDAWDEQVLVKEAWDEQVLVKEAWDEQVLVSEEWYEQVVVGAHHRFYYDGYIAYTDDEAINHAFELAQQGIETNAYYLEYDFDTIYHPDTYETVHHEAEYTTVHHEAEYTTVHHDAEYTTVHHDAEGYWA